MSGNGLGSGTVYDYMDSDILNKNTAKGKAAYDEWITYGTGGLVIGPSSVLGSPFGTDYMVQFSDALPSFFPTDFANQCPPLGLQWLKIGQGLKTPANGLSMGVCVLGFPKSRANIKLNSNNPDDDIIFSPNFYDHNDDVMTMVDCMTKLRGRTGVDLKGSSGIYGPSLQVVKYAKTPFRPYRGIEIYPGANILKFNQWHAVLSDYITKCSNSAYHVFGSTPMGLHRLDGSVVDPKLIVHGFENLRVADAGVIPSPYISSGPMVTTYMIGERCASFIAEKYPPVPAACPSTEGNCL
jgi:choline dehydrogenase-like flavoprotein